MIELLATNNKKQVDYKIKLSAKLRYAHQKNTRRSGVMKKYVCDICGWEYDEEIGCEELGIPAGTKFEDLPEDFVCPLCGVGADSFSEAE